jgi:DNA-directed RNA polymerase specialized sigma24 family protein
MILASFGVGGPEIAQAIGRTQGATRTLLCRARARMRTSLLAAQAG